MAGRRETIEEDRRHAAERALRQAGDSEVVGTSALSRAADVPEAPQATGNGDPSDPAEIWGKRVGRGLGIAAVVALAVYLFAEYGPR